jgi:uncharacterized membrane protein
MFSQRTICTSHKLFFAALLLSGAPMLATATHAPVSPPKLSSSNAEAATVNRSAAVQEPDEDRASAIQLTAIDFPGAVYTSPQGINPAGDIVGAYDDASGKRHGFLLSRGNFTSIDYPGAMTTDARGINRHGDIVGTFVNAPGGLPNMHGYLLSHGTFTEVQYPGSLGSIAQRITPNGNIYGCVHDKDFMASMRAFVRTAEGFTVLDRPASMSNGATPDGSTVVGLYTDMMGTTRGYTIEDGEFHSFDVPGSNFTEGWDINPQGDIVGDFRDLAGKTHGFLRTEDGYTTIDFPAATLTVARGINPRGDIVGRYIDAQGKTHGFLRAKPRATSDASNTGN